MHAFAFSGKRSDTAKGRAFSRPFKRDWLFFFFLSFVWLRWRRTVKVMTSARFNLCRHDIRRVITWEGDHRISKVLVSSNTCVRGGLSLPTTSGHIYKHPFWSLYHATVRCNFLYGAFAYGLQFHIKMGIIRL